MPTREEMSAATRTRVVIAAHALFSAQTYDGTTLGEIAAAAGVTKGAIYHHYADKEELLLEVQHHLLDQAIANSEEIFARRMAPPKELRALVGLHLRAVTEQRVTLSFTTPEWRKMGDSERWTPIRAKRDRIERFVVTSIERGCESGDFKRIGEPRLVAYGLLGMCYWSNVWYVRGGRWSLDLIADTLTTTVLDGLTA